MKKVYDVIIIGGGPAGLSAALVLGRCLRQVLVCDGGHPRNEVALRLNGFLTRDGVPSQELLRLGREELKSYDNVTLVQDRAVDARKDGEGFEVTLLEGQKARCRKLLLATGLVDEVPKLKGIEAIYGRSAFICPYCDGWEQKGRALAVYGQGQRGFHMARGLKNWSDDLILFTNGPSRLTTQQHHQLRSHDISICDEPIESLESHDGELAAVILKGGRRVPRQALFFDTPSYQKSVLARKLGCEFKKTGGVKAKKYQATNVPGLYVAGNITRDVVLAIVAASEGAKAAFGINVALTREDFRKQ